MSPKAQGCDRCRKSKKKCDLEYPVCGRCYKSNRECVWPNSSFQGPEYNHPSIDAGRLQSYEQVADFVVITSREHSLIAQYNSKILPLLLSPQYYTNSSRYASELIFSNRTVAKAVCALASAYLESYPTTSPSSPQSPQPHQISNFNSSPNSLANFNSSPISSSSSSESFTDKARKFHLEAKRSLYNSVHNEKLGGSEDWVLFTTLCLSAYERRRLPIATSILTSTINMNNPISFPSVSLSNTNTSNSTSTITITNTSANTNTNTNTSSNASPIISSNTSGSSSTTPTSTPNLNPSNLSTPNASLSSSSSSSNSTKNKLKTPPILSTDTIVATSTTSPYRSFSMAIDLASKGLMACTDIMRIFLGNKENIKDLLHSDSPPEIAAVNSYASFIRSMLTSWMTQVLTTICPLGTDWFFINDVIVTYNAINQPLSSAVNSGAKNAFINPAISVIPLDFFSCVCQVACLSRQAYLVDSQLRTASKLIEYFNSWIYLLDPILIPTPITSTNNSQQQNLDLSNQSINNPSRSSNRPTTLKPSIMDLTHHGHSSSNLNSNSNSAASNSSSPSTSSNSSPMSPDSLRNQNNNSNITNDSNVLLDPIQYNPHEHDQYQYQFQQLQIQPQQQIQSQNQNTNQQYSNLSKQPSLQNILSPSSVASSPHSTLSASPPATQHASPSSFSSTSSFSNSSSPFNFDASQQQQQQQAFYEQQLMPPPSGFPQTRDRQQAANSRSSFSGGVNRQVIMKNKYGTRVGMTESMALHVYILSVASSIVLIRLLNSGTVTVYDTTIRKLVQSGIKGLNDLLKADEDQRASDIASGFRPRPGIIAGALLLWPILVFACAAHSADILCDDLAPSINYLSSIDYTIDAQIVLLMIERLKYFKSIQPQTLETVDFGFKFITGQNSNWLDYIS